MKQKESPKNPQKGPKKAKKKIPPWFDLDLNLKPCKTLRLIDT